MRRTFRGGWRAVTCAATTVVALAALASACGGEPSADVEARGDGSAATSVGTVPTSAPRATGLVAGTLTVPDGWQEVHLALEDGDGAAVDGLTATAATSFAFDEVPPGPYRLVTQLSTGVVEGEGGVQTSGASVARTPVFTVAEGSVLRFTCSDRCTPE